MLVPLIKTVHSRFQVLPVCDRILYGEEGELTRLIELYPSLAPYADESDDENALTKDDEEVAHV